MLHPLTITQTHSPTLTHSLTAHTSLHSRQVWDIRSREPLATYKGHAGAVLKAKFSPDGKLIASGDELGVLRVRVEIGICLL